jgi:UDP-N-acetylmuramate dehydrogenase
MADKNDIQKVLGDVGGQILFDEPMSRHTSLRVGGNADALVIIENEDQLTQIVWRLRQARINYLPAGNLTNIIVLDGGYRGVILLMSGLQEINYQQTPDGGHVLFAQAGTALAKLVEMAADQELAGLEFCAGIPGSVGGAVWMNAGAFGKEIKDVVTEVALLETDGRKKIRKREEMTFHYRKTILPEDAVILGARFKLEKGRPAEIRQTINEILKTRREKHPLTHPNAGSIFKNLPGLPAGRLIEEMGLKGTCCGDAQISPRHANFIINKGGATAAAVMELISIVQDKAQKEKGVRLETEVIVIGENECRRN